MVLGGAGVEAAPCLGVAFLGVAQGPLGSVQEKLHNLTTDGIGEMLAERINNLSEEEFDMWLKYHLSTCEREDLIGYGSHILYIGKKK